MSDKTRGLYGKFRVERTDGRSAPGEKHHGCAYFVLDLEHDENAGPALHAYAEACRAEFPQLAESLMRALKKSDPTACGCREAGCPHVPILGWPSLGLAFSREMEPAADRYRPTEADMNAQERKAREKIEAVEAERDEALRDYEYLAGVVVDESKDLVTAPEECPPDAVRELARLARDHHSEKDNWVAALRRVEAKLSAAREALE